MTTPLWCWEGRTCLYCCQPVVAGETSRVRLLGLLGNVEERVLLVLRCHSCQLRYLPFWVRSVKDVDLILPDCGVPPYFPLSLSLWISVDVFRWFDKLLLFGGVPAHCFVLCWRAAVSVPEEHLDAVQHPEFFTVYLLFVLVDLVVALDFRAAMAVPPLAPGADRLRLRFTGRAAVRRTAVQEALTALHPHMLAAFQLRWVTTHADWCSAGCSHMVLLDGNEKLAPKGCCCVVAGAGADVVFCSRAPRRGRLTCNLPAHRAQELPLVRTHAQRRNAARRLPWLCLFFLFLGGGRVVSFDVFLAGWCHV